MLFVRADRCGFSQLSYAKSLLSPLAQVQASILYKSIAGHHRPVSYPDGPIMARYRFIKNAYWSDVCTRNIGLYRYNNLELYIPLESCKQILYLI